MTSTPFKEVTTPLKTCPETDVDWSPEGDYEGFIIKYCALSKSYLFSESRLRKLVSSFVKCRIRTVFSSSVLLTVLLNNIATILLVLCPY